MLQKPIPHGVPLTVLAIEDDHKKAASIKLNLQRDGYRVLVAHDGVEAIVMARATRPALVIASAVVKAIHDFVIRREKEGIIHGPCRAKRHYHGHYAATARWF